jgi:hypothetical protein
MSPRNLLVASLAIAATGVQAEPITWPQQLDADSGATVIVYQPQVEDFSGNRLEARAAVAVKNPESGDAPVFGAIWISAKLDVDRETRTALIRSIDVTEVRFADATQAEKQQLAAFIEAQVAGSALTISVDQLLADLDAAEGAAAAANLKHDPPKIILSAEPALLVSIDGEPVFEDIEGSAYERIINTPYLIARGGKDLYLYVGSNAWYQAQSVSGPWTRASRVPAEVEKLVEPAEDDAEAVEDMKIIIATMPTELVVADGEPSWSPVEGMNLLYMDNTDSDVFLELSTQSYYVLLSGRWYRGTGMHGDIEWTHVPNDELPEPFSDIPEGSVNGSVLSHVAGTQQAREAVLDNTIPQTAAIRRDDTSFSVEYDGKPDFAPIEDIPVEYAQNTSAAVFRYGHLYYACDDGVWYVANSATGPWNVATEVPDAIYRIPASNPHHNVTYVKVYDVTPTVVYTGYTPGYYGSYYYSGTVVYGTGWYYNPWYGPYYYPRYPTWGFHLHYNPWYGWSFGVSWTSGPFRFTFGTHAGWWGVGGYRPYPRPVVYGGYRKTNININVDNSINIGGGNRTRPESRPNLYDRPENRIRNAERPSVPADRRARPVTGDVPNNVLTDRSGNVYQRDTNGSWQQRNNGQWQSPQNLDRVSPQAPGTRPAQPSFDRPTTRPTADARDFPQTRPMQPAVRPQLEQDFHARQRGAARAQSFQRASSPRRR